MIPCEECLVQTLCRQRVIEYRSVVRLTRKSECPYLIEYLVKDGSGPYDRKLNKARVLLGLDQLAGGVDGYHRLKMIHKRITE